MFLKIIFIPILAFDNSTYLNKKIIAKVTTHTPTPKTITKGAPVKTIAKKAPAKKVKTLTKKK